MKNMKKNALVTTLIATSLLLVGCNQGGSAKEKEKEFTLSLSESDIALTVGDFSKLIASNSYNQEVSLTWTSTNSLVASVDAYGKVEALRDGEAYVIASYNDVSASCKVTVSAGYYVPNLTFINEVETNSSIMKGNELNLATEVKFNGRVFNDASITYTLSNPLAGSMKGNVFQAGQVSGIGTDIEIKASWRNFQTPTLIKNIHVDIIPIGQVILNEGELSDVHVFVTDRIGEKEYKQVQQITSIEGKFDGENVDIEEVKLINNQSFDDPSKEAATLNYDLTLNSGKITGVREGTAQLVVKLVGGYTQTFNIEVDLPYYKVDTKVPYFSLKDGLYFNEDSKQLSSVADFFIEGEKSITKAYQEDRKLNVVDNKLTDVKADTALMMKEATVVIYNSKMAVEVTLEAYTKIVSTIDDFYDIIFSNDGAAKSVSGYYYLVNDIKALDTPISKVGSPKINKFTGVFEGNGHVIEAKLERGATDNWGLFGNQLGGTVRNVAFNNCVSEAANAGFFAEASIAGCLLQNVYLNISVDVLGRTNTPVMGAFCSTYGELQAKQVIVETAVALESNYTTTNFYFEGALAIHRVKNTVDLFIVSPGLIGGRIIESDPATAASKNLKSYLSKAEADADSVFIAMGGTQHILTENGSKVYKYNNNTEFKAAGKSYENFSTTFWDLSEGYPRFKGTF